MRAEAVLGSTAVHPPAPRWPWEGIWRALQRLCCGKWFRGHSLKPWFVGRVIVFCVICFVLGFVTDLWVMLGSSRHRSIEWGIPEGPGAEPSSHCCPELFPPFCPRSHRWQLSPQNHGVVGLGGVLRFTWIHPQRGLAAPPAQAVLSPSMASGTSRIGHPQLCALPWPHCPLREEFPPHTWPGSPSVSVKPAGGWCRPQGSECSKPLWKEAALIYFPSDLPCFILSFGKNTLKKAGGQLWGCRSPLPAPAWIPSTLWEGDKPLVSLGKASGQIPPEPLLGSSPQGWLWIFPAQQQWCLWRARWDSNYPAVINATITLATLAVCRETVLFPTHIPALQNSCGLAKPSIHSPIRVAEGMGWMWANIWDPVVPPALGCVLQGAPRPGGVVGMGCRGAVRIRWSWAVGGSLEMLFPPIK